MEGTLVLWDTSSLQKKFLPRLGGTILSITTRSDGGMLVLLDDCTLLIIDADFVGVKRVVLGWMGRYTLDRVSTFETGTFYMSPSYHISYLLIPPICRRKQYYLSSRSTRIPPTPHSILSLCNPLYHLCPPPP